MARGEWLAPFARERSLLQAPGCGARGAGRIPAHDSVCVLWLRLGTVDPQLQPDDADQRRTCACDGSAQPRGDSGDRLRFRHDHNGPDIRLRAPQWRAHKSGRDALAVVCWRMRLEASHSLLGWTVYGFDPGRFDCLGLLHWCIAADWRHGHQRGKWQQFIWRVPICRDPASRSRFQLAQPAHLGRERILARDDGYVLLVPHGSDDCQAQR